MLSNKIFYQEGFSIMRKCKLLALLFLLIATCPTPAFASALPYGCEEPAVAIQTKCEDRAFPGQTIRFELCGIANKSGYVLEDFYIHDRLPTDAVRLKSLTTGRFNEMTYYKISYRTNLHDYKILAAKLLSTNNYELSLHPNVLGLSAGEYIKDIRFEFPRVYPGFKSVDNISLFCEVMLNLPTGYSIVNRADLGGYFRNDLHSASASWKVKAGPSATVK